jgi:hypothetical protein
LEQRRSYQNWRLSPYCSSRSTKEQPDYTVWNATEDISIQELTSSTESLHLGNGVSPHLTKAESATTLSRVKRAEIWTSAWWFAAAGEIPLYPEGRVCAEMLYGGGGEKNKKKGSDDADASV